jgi:hypothetical protein
MKYFIVFLSISRKVLGRYCDMSHHHILKLGHINQYVPNVNVGSLNRSSYLASMICIIIFRLLHHVVNDDLSGLLDD